MQKTNKIEKNIMKEIKLGKIKMLPKWYFVLASILMTAGLASAFAIATFLINFSFFLLHRIGSQGQWKIEAIARNFPIWLPITTIILLISGILLLKKYDFSYKHNFKLIIGIAIASIFIGALVLDKWGINEILSTRGPMRKLYEQNKNYGGQMRQFGRNN